MLILVRLATALALTALAAAAVAVPEIGGSEAASTATVLPAGLPPGATPDAHGGYLVPPVELDNIAPVIGDPPEAAVSPTPTGVYLPAGYPAPLGTPP